MAPGVGDLWTKLERTGATPGTTGRKGTGGPLVTRFLPPVENWGCWTRRSLRRWRLGVEGFGVGESASAAAGAGSSASSVGQEQPDPCVSTTKHQRESVASATAAPQAVRKPERATITRIVQLDAECRFEGSDALLCLCSKYAFCWHRIISPACRRHRTEQLGCQPPHASCV